MNKQEKAQVAELLAEAYGSLAHTEYNLAGSVNTAPLVSFREALRLLEIDINPYLPSECPRV